MCSTNNTAPPLVPAHFARQKCTSPHPRFFSNSFSKSGAFRRQLLSIRRDFNSTIGQTVLLFILLFLLVFIITAHTIVHREYVKTNINFHSYSHFTYASNADSAIFHHLHYHYSIPQRYLRLMTRDNHRSLFQLLSKSHPNSTSHTSARRIVFTYVTDCSLQACLRAMATSATYAAITHRIALVFVDDIAGASIHEIISLKRGGILNDHAMIIPLYDNTDIRSSVDQFNGYDDWAEFNVAHAVAPNTLLQASAHGGMHAFSINRSLPETPRDISAYGTERLPTIGNTQKVATLDNLAGLDTHIFVALSEVVWSQYAPRSVQESVMGKYFHAVPPFPQRLISRSSLLGRHVQTRDIRTTDRALASTFKVPRMFLRGMTPLARRLLLLKLLGKKRKGIDKPRVIFVHVQYGLGNRLRALGSAMAFARRTDRVLVLIWVPDQHLNCKYTDLFVTSDEFVISHKFGAREEWPFENNTKSDANMKMVKWYNFMRVNGLQVNSSSVLVTDDKAFHLYISTCYVIQSPVTPFIIRTTSSFWYVLKSLAPHLEVLKLVERYESYPLSSMIGIHIRGRSIKSDISGVNAKDYTKESSRTTDYWRNLTQVDTFIEEMRKQHEDQLFYVAADSVEVFRRLEKEFPSRIFYTPRNCDSRDMKCLPFALADILLLAQCSSLRGSYWSSFSELSTRIGGARFLLAGIDFGRPQ